MNAAPPRPSPSWSTREEQEEEEGTPSSSSSSPSPVQRGAVGGRWDREMSHRGDSRSAEGDTERGDMMEEMEEMEEEEAFSLPVEPFIIKREELEDEEEMQQQEEEEVEEEERWPRVKVEMDDSDDGSSHVKQEDDLAYEIWQRSRLKYEDGDGGDDDDDGGGGSGEFDSIYKPVPCL
ncbi:uncharacterized protein LOC144737617 [Lampetra planeri]